MSKFLKFRRWLEHDTSNSIKKNTGSDLFDWISLIVLFGGGSLLLLILFVNSLIKANDFLSGFILWFTAFVVMRYTKETYYLKKIAQQQLEDSQQTRMNEFLPIIIPVKGGKLHNSGGLDFIIKNIGKGIAKVQHIKVYSVTVEENFSLEPNQTRPVKPGDEITKTLGIHLKSASEAIINAEVWYEDIFGRTFRTVEIAFYRNGNDGFILDRGKWKFQIINNNTWENLDITR